MAIKSRAQRFLESLREDDSGMDPQADQDPGTVSVDPGTETDPPTEPETVDVAAAIGSITDPEQLAEALDAMDGQLDKFEDTDDDSTYSPENDDDKEVLTEARAYMREAACKLREMKKY